MRDVPGIRMRISVTVPAVSSASEPSAGARRADFVRAAEEAAASRPNAQRWNLFFVGVAPGGGQVLREVTASAARMVMSALEVSRDEGDVVGWAGESTIGVLLASTDAGAIHLFETRFWRNLAAHESSAKGRPVVDIVAAHLVAQPNGSPLDVLIDEGTALVIDGAGPPSHPASQPASRRRPL